MWFFWLLGLLIFCNQAILISAENAAIFTAVSPKAIFPHSVYNISIAVEEGGGPTMFTATISSAGKSYSAQEVKINAGMSDVLSLEVNDLPDESYNLTIKSDTSGSKFADSTTIFVDRKERSVLIQTDKPIYKPGETVLFRVVILNRSLKPFEEKQLINVQILDPSRNVIKIWDKQNVARGLLSLKLELSSEPVLGDWTVQVKSEDLTESQQFSVAQYVLPKFKVEVKLPPFITFNSSKIRAEIKASYTYGKALKGDCTATLVRKGYYYQPAGELHKVISKHVPIDGIATVEFDSVKEDFGLYNFNSFYNEMEFEVEATVKDNVTGREQNGTAKVKMYKLPYKVEYIEQATMYQPGLPFIMKFKVSYQDNTPINEPGEPSQLEVTHGFSYHAEGSIVKETVPPNGVVTFTFITPSNEHLSVSNVEVRYKEFKQTFYLPQRMISASKTYVQLSLKTEKASIGEEIELNLKATKEFSSFKYFVYGRGIILLSATEVLSAPAKDHSFKIKAPQEAAPEGKVVIYTMFGEKHEIIAHSVKFTLDSVLSNELDLKLSSDMLEPGQNLTISMKSKANSIIALRGVDQSVLLLKDDKDINRGRIDAELLEMDKNRNNRNRIWGGSGSFQVFEQVGLVVLTNGFLEKAVYFTPIHHPHRGGGIMFKGMNRMEAVNFAADEEAPMARMAAAPMMMKAKGIASTTVPSHVGTSAEIRVRKSFPETWLWEEFWLDAQNSSTTFDKVVPDTLTSWIITGYSLNSEAGIGVSGEPLVLKTFRPFFISLNLPYSVVKGEVLSLQVLVHNYLENDITAKITLQNDEGKFKFTDPKSAKEKLMTTEVKVGAADVTSVTFVIIPVKFGIVMLNVKGRTDLAGDAVSQPLTVKPPGHKQLKNKAVLIDLRSKKSLNYNLTAAFPEKRVADADAVKISVIADLLGTTISNLDKLLQMPCGCGEQNMINFVPDIVILDYLSSTNKMTTAIKAKALKFLESGYQRELTYRHYDGSFSAFGNSDPVGSTWLTAFVVRAFVAAKPYITVDENIISQSLQYLSLRQLESGSFQELGHVIHSDMQGGSSSGYALSAYTLLAFIEASKNSSIHRDQYANSIERGLNYIAEASSNSHTKSDIYATILIAYALELAKHTHRDKYFGIVKEHAISVGDLTHWEQKAAAGAEEQTKHHPWESNVRPVTVEMTSYALMIYMLRDELEGCLPIGKWLLKQRNAEGGFISTQDTVVGLTALAKFAKLTSGTETDILVKAEYEGGTQEVKVNDGNAIVLQEFHLPSTVKTVRFAASGKGTALAQLTWSFYVEDETARPAFTINVEAEAVTTKLKLNICTKYTAGNISNMAVVEVNVPSGYSFDPEELVTLKTIANVKRYELEDGDSKLIVYFDYFTNTKNCLKVAAQKIFSVGKQAPAYVLVYDYYDTTKKARAFYEAPKVSESACPVCVEGEVCNAANCIE